MGSVFEKHKSALVGVWTLISAEMYDSEGPARKLLLKPYGDDPQGKVIISSSGYLLATLVSPPGLKPLSQDDWTHATDEEVLRVGRALTSYGGFMELHEQDDGSLLWHTKVEIASNPNWIGKMQTRVARSVEENGDGYMTLNPVKWYTLQVSREITRQRQADDGKIGWEASTRRIQMAPDRCLNNHVRSLIPFRSSPCLLEVVLDFSFRLLMALWRPSCG
jgi:hypothetical protein